MPHPGNLYREKVPGAVYVGNGFGKLAGSTQVEEMGDIETPILLASTTSVPRVADAVISYMLAVPGNEDVLSINPIVGETNDGYLNDIRGRHITPEDIFGAIKCSEGRSGGRGSRRRWDRHSGLRLEGRHWNVFASIAGETRRMDCGCPGANKLWRCAHD